VKICVAGLEPELREHCRVVLRELDGEDSELITSSLDSELPEADVYIREFQPGSYLAGFSPEMVRRSLFVIEPRLLEQFRERLGTQRASILLKPVRQAALCPFLEHSIRQVRPPASRPIPAASSETDNLLDCLLHANFKLQESDHSPTNFLARAAHDLRAPLTALSGYCGLMIAQRLGPLNTVQVDLLGRMQRSIKRVSRLADAMCDLSAGRHTKKPPDLQQADVESCISQAVQEITPHVEEKQIRLTVSVENPENRLAFDPTKIEQVLVNLLENACKFTPKHGVIEVSGYPVFWNNGSTCLPLGAASFGGRTPSVQIPNAYRIDVQDSGNGRTSEHLESIFEEHTTFAGGKNRSGDGLALAICRMIVEQHRGNIWAKSYGAGAQFSFVIPHSPSAGLGGLDAGIAAAPIPANTLSALEAPR